MDEDTKNKSNLNRIFQILLSLEWSWVNSFLCSCTHFAPINEKSVTHSTVFFISQVFLSEIISNVLLILSSLSSLMYRPSVALFVTGNGFATKQFPNSIFHLGISQSVD